MNTPLVILSPHFDDSVLSCGGRIWQARQQGNHVRVLSLFAGPPVGAPPPFAVVQHHMWGDPPDPNRLRRAEDITAHVRLGCFDVRHLEAPDAVYRVAKGGRPLYGTEEAIFGAVDPEEHRYMQALVELVQPHLDQGALIAAPLGAGHHVDHQLARAVGLTLLDEGWQVELYEELPYVEAPDALEGVDKVGWEVQSIPISAEALDAKIAAVGYYRSQIPVLYGDEAEMSRRVRAIAERAADGNGYAERVWRPRK